MNLNLGCGGHAPDGWVNIDRSFGTRSFPCHPNMLADARDLPFPDGSVDAVYAGHVLEHVAFDEVPVALREIKRVLKPEGRLAVVGPDMDRAVGEWADFRESIWPGLDGEWSSWEGAGHAWRPTGENTLRLVWSVFPTVHEVPIGELDSFWPASNRDGWQFAAEVR